MMTGCAAINEKQVRESYGSGQIVYFEVNNPNYKYGEDAIKLAESSGTNLCKDISTNYCKPEYRSNIALHNGNIKVSLTKILKLNVLTPKNVEVKKYDIVKAQFQTGENAKSNVASFLSVSDPSDCKWDGTGVICKSGWDYRKDLPVAMR